MISADRLFRALSDPTRLRILRLLRGGELCVGDLEKILGVPQAKTSRHLAYLRRSGLVRTRAKGLWVFYSLVPSRNGLHRRIIECVAHAPANRGDERRAARVRNGGGCCP